jgi:type I restriction enzyme S subunit
MPVCSDSDAGVKQGALVDGVCVREAPSGGYSVTGDRTVRIADLKPYPECKESGLPWLGQVPIGWRVVRNGSLFGQRNETGRDELPILEVSLKTGIRVRNFEASARKQVMSDKGKYKRAAKGDVAYNMMRMWQGAVGVSPVDGLVSPAYVVARPYPEVEARYFNALFRTGDYLSEIDNCSRGIVKDRNRLYWNDFKQILSPCPPPEEQTAIVRFLDWVNGRLERAIRAKRKVIALLNEQKQAIIHRAVTCGLDPSVSVKPSGIPWLGDIPEHWEARKVKFLVSTVGGMTPNKGVARFWEGPIAWVSPKDMKVHEIVDSQDHITNDALRATGIALIKPPAVLIVVRGMILARTFPTAVTVIPVTVNQDMKALIPKSKLDAYFLALLLTGIQSELLYLVEEAGHGTRCLRTDSWANFSIPLPPVKEQIRINEALKSQIDGVNTAISRLEREIDLLREYRTRLVADVVTGKLDVREAAARLPDEAPLEPFEDDSDLTDEIDSLAEEEAAA